MFNMIKDLQNRFGKVENGLNSLEERVILGLQGMQEQIDGVQEQLEWEEQARKIWAMEWEVEWKEKEGKWEDKLAELQTQIEKLQDKKEKNGVRSNYIDDREGDDEEEEDVNIAVDASKIERDDDGDEDHDDDDDNDIDGEHDEISASTFNGSKGNSEHPKKNSKRRLVRDWIKKGIRRMLTSSTNLAQTITNRELKVHEKRYDIYVH